MGMAKNSGGAARAKLFPADRNTTAQPCDYCKSTEALFFCKADGAALCATCDRDIHSANPLSRRHDRYPVAPFYGTAESAVKSAGETSFGQEPINEFDPWNVSANPFVENVAAGDVDEVEMKPAMEFLFSEADYFLDFQHPICLQAESVVPGSTIRIPPVATEMTDFSPENRPEIGFSTRSNVSLFNNDYTTRSLSHSISSSSLEVGVVPEGSSIMSDTTYPFVGNVSSQVDLSGNSLSGKDREARVLRYREKKKNRKFEKTIRYASRKAYAETRPRIKGRFAKRTEVESEVDPLFHFGVVPSLLC